MKFASRLKRKLPRVKWTSCHTRSLESLAAQLRGHVPPKATARSPPTSNQQKHEHEQQHQQQQRQLQQQQLEQQQKQHQNNSYEQIEQDLQNHRRSPSNNNPNWKRRDHHHSYERRDDNSHQCYAGQEVVLIMDSNMNHIDAGRFWRSTFKLKCGRADLLENKLENHDLSNAKHIFVGTGTNDVERGDDAKSIFSKLEQAVKKLSASYKGNIYLAQLPPMTGKENEVVKEINTLIKEKSPPNINIILHENITHEDLHDTKHIRHKSIFKFVKNFKDEMRKVTESSKDVNYHAVPWQYGHNQPANNGSNDKRNSVPQSSRHDGRPVHTYDNKTSEAGGGGNHSGQKQSPEGPSVENQGHDFIAKVLQAIQVSNENLVNGLRTSLLGGTMIMN